MAKIFAESVQTGMVDVSTGLECANIRETEKSVWITWGENKPRLYRKNTEIEVEIVSVAGLTDINQIDALMDETTCLSADEEHVISEILETVSGDLHIYGKAATGAVYFEMEDEGFKILKGISPCCVAGLGDDVAGILSDIISGAEYSVEEGGGWHIDLDVDIVDIDEFERVLVEYCGHGLNEVWPEAGLTDDDINKIDALVDGITCLSVDEEHVISEILETVSEDLYINDKKATGTIHFELDDEGFKILEGMSPCCVAGLGDEVVDILSEIVDSADYSIETGCWYSDVDVDIVDITEFEKVLVEFRGHGFRNKTTLMALAPVKPASKELSLYEDEENVDLEILDIKGSDGASAILPGFKMQESPVAPVVQAIDELNTTEKGRLERNHLLTRSILEEIANNLVKNAEGDFHDNGNIFIHIEKVEDYESAMESLSHIYTPEDGYFELIRVIQSSLRLSLEKLIDTEHSYIIDAPTICIEKDHMPLFMQILHRFGCSTGCIKQVINDHKGLIGLHDPEVYMAILNYFSQHIVNSNNGRDLSYYVEIKLAETSGQVEKEAIDRIINAARSCLWSGFMINSSYQKDLLLRIFRMVRDAMESDEILCFWMSKSEAIWFNLIIRRHYPHYVVEGLKDIIAIIETGRIN